MRAWEGCWRGRRGTEEEPGALSGQTGEDQAPRGQRPGSAVTGMCTPAPGAFRNILLRIEPWNQVPQCAGSLRWPWTAVSSLPLGPTSPTCNRTFSCLRPEEFPGGLSHRSSDPALAVSSGGSPDSQQGKEGPISLGVYNIETMRCQRQKGLYICLIVIIRKETLEQHQGLYRSWCQVKYILEEFLTSLKIKLYWLL